MAGQQSRNAGRTFRQSVWHYVSQVAPFMKLFHLCTILAMAKSDCFTNTGEMRNGSVL